MNNDQSTKNFDLEGRTLEFGRRVVRLCRSLNKDAVNLKLVDQLIRSGTSIGANYREGNEITTKKDFKHKMQICIKEAKETLYWLELICEANPDIISRTESLKDENKQLIRIFSAVIQKSKSF